MYRKSVGRGRDGNIGKRLKVSVCGGLNFPPQNIYHHVNKLQEEKIIELNYE